MRRRNKAPEERTIPSLSKNLAPEKEKRIAIKLKNQLGNSKIPKNFRLGKSRIQEVPGRVNMGYQTKMQPRRGR